MSMKPSTRPVSHRAGPLAAQEVRTRYEDAATPGLSSERLLTISSRKRSVRYYLVYGHF